VGTLHCPEPNSWHPAVLALPSGMQEKRHWAGGLERACTLFPSVEVRVKITNDSHVESLHWQQVRVTVIPLWTLSCLHVLSSGGRLGLRIFYMSMTILGWPRICVDLCVSAILFGHDWVTGRDTHRQIGLFCMYRLLLYMQVIRHSFIQQSTQWMSHENAQKLL